MPLPIYCSFWVKIGPKIKRNGTCICKKWNSFNNARKDGTFVIDLVMLIPCLRNKRTMVEIRLWNCSFECLTYQSEMMVSWKTTVTAFVVDFIYFNMCTPSMSEKYMQKHGRTTWSVRPIGQVLKYTRYCWMAITVPQEGGGETREA